MKLRLKYYPATLLQLLLPLVLLWIFRFIFTYYNLHNLGSPSFGRIFHLAMIGLRFDLSAWAWFNAPFILLRFLPFNFVTGRKYLLFTNILYFILNLLMLLPALADIPFFQYNGSHLRWQAITTIWTDPNINGIILSFAKDYWLAFLLAFLLAGVLAWSAFGIRPEPVELSGSRKRVYRWGALVVVVAGTALAIRGHVGPGRPLSIGDGVWGTSEASQVNIVLNAPFCIIRTLHHDLRVPQMDFFTPEQLAAMRNSVHSPGAYEGVTLQEDTLLREGSKKNIMVLTIESGSSIWLRNLSPLRNDTTVSMMPFLDSLSYQAVVFPHAYTTGIRSIEGITGIFGGVPTFGDMILMTSPYFTNTFDAPAKLLKDEGYASRFYFGGNHGSFNIDQTLKTFGFEEIKTRDEYGNDDDFDGEWGIWDHKMGAYAARDLTTLPEPFIAGWFTLNPHGPFEVPSDWQTEGYISSDAMKKTVEYEDRALRHFFEVAKTQPWYANTIFVILGDHGCRDLKGTIYDSSFVLPHITTMIYAPDGSFEPRRIEDKAVSQLDISATLLDLAGYDHDYVQLGESILSPGHRGYALMYIHGAYQVCSPEYAVRLSPDLKRVEEVYDITKDYAMASPLTDYPVEKIDDMANWARAFMQDYTHRLNSDDLSVTRSSIVEQNPAQ